MVEKLKIILQIWHRGNLCVDEEGKLVYYDFGMMDELKPNVRSGFRKFCKALFKVSCQMLHYVNLAIIFTHVPCYCFRVGL